MLGQNGHFRLYAPEPIPYAIDRYSREAERLYGVLDRRLTTTGAHVAGEAFTVADMAIFPWVVTHKAQGLSLDDYPAVKTWFARVRARPGVQAGMAVGRATRPAEMDAETRRNLFGQTPPIPETR
jgi:GST-like protein